MKSPFRDRDSECFGPVQQLSTKVEGRIAEIMRNAVGKETCSDMQVQFTEGEGQSSINFSFNRFHVTFGELRIWRRPFGSWSEMR